MSNETNNTMKTLIHTSTYTSQNGDVYMKVRTQTYNANSHKAKNEFFVNGKIVRLHERYIAESTLDEAHPSDVVKTELKTP